MGVADKCVLWTADSREMAPAALLERLGGRQARFIHIDGEHSRAALTKDLELSTAVLQPGGILVLDDMLHPGYPTLPILQGHDQPGPHHRNCYRCGATDHISGDPACQAGPLDGWKGAPAAWKARFGPGKGKGNRQVKGKGRGKGAPKGKGKGSSYQRNLGARPALEPDTSNGICHNWARGNGYCKYGPNCNFKHEGPQGGGKRKDPFTSLLTSGNAKKARKKMVSLLINDFKESLSKDGSEPLGDKGTTDEKPEREDDTIYRLLRGAPTLIVVRSKGEALW
jgi:hypothetical protein